MTVKSKQLRAASGVFKSNKNLTHHFRSRSLGVRLRKGRSAEGRMVDPFARMVENLARRVDGPLHFRLIVQPTVAAVMALRAGIRDERDGKPPFLWAVLLRSGDHRELLREAWRDLRNILIIALTLDVTYQLIVHRRIYPLELVITVAALAIVPYIIVRGPINRILVLLRRHRGINFARNRRQHGPA